MRNFAPVSMKNLTRCRWPQVAPAYWKNRKNHEKFRENIVRINQWGSWPGLGGSRMVKKSENTNRKNKICMRAGVNHEELDQVRVATCGSRVLKTKNIRKKWKSWKNLVKMMYKHDIDNSAPASMRIWLGASGQMWQPRAEKKSWKISWKWCAHDIGYDRCDQNMIIQARRKGLEVKLGPLT